MINYLINKVRGQIDDHEAQGGSIYDERRMLSYYDNLLYLRDKLKVGNPEITIEDTYRLCGHPMDREYHRFELFNEELSRATDMSGYVDKVKSNPEHSHAKNVLNMLAKDLGCSPSDYLVLMTKYRYRKAIIQCDYVSKLSSDILKEYPDGNISGIKREHPNLYNRLKHFSRYIPENISPQDVLYFFGLMNDGFSDTPISEDECSMIKYNFKKKYDPSTIEKVSDFEFGDYQRLNRVAIKEGIAIYDMLISLGYNVKNHANVASLSRTKVNAEEREKELLTARRQVIAELLANGEDIPQDDIGLYYFNKKVAGIVLERIYDLIPVDENPAELND